MGVIVSSIVLGKGRVKVTLEALFVFQPCLLQVGSNHEAEGSVKCPDLMYRQNQNTLTFNHNRQSLKDNPDPPLQPCSAPFDQTG